MKFNILGNYYDKAFHLPATSGPLAVENIIKRFSPADLSLLLWETPIDYRDVDRVIESANIGFKAWRKIKQEERNHFLKKYQEEVSKRKDDIALAISYEMGKPLWESQTEVASVIAKINVTIEDSLPRIANRHFDNIMPKTNGHVFYKPIGPSLVIGPFNFPCHLANGQILSALVAGNSIIFKPSEKTCYSAQILIECFHAAGFPAGVINMIQGDGEIARRLLKEKSIKAVFFTGSKEVGKKILDITHNDLGKLVSLELGGKNTTILHSDANKEHALQELLKACFLTTGQRCTSTSIVAIERSIHEEFIAKFHELSKKIIIDHPVEFIRAPFMGPLVDQGAVDAYLLFMGMAKREGIQEIMRGKLLEKTKKGHYVTPSIHLADRWNNDSVFLQSEIFGPNVTFIPYNTIEEAIQIANSTEYGLASSVFTKNRDIYQMCVDEIDSGLINFNRSTVGASAKLPFGGVKNSGNYRPAALTTIDACVYQMASLEVLNDDPDDIKSIIGLDL
ncbi:MAG: aldehyde dehydrogenase family protein [Bacteriovorax sp.]|jgi:succinylglutamic semialdehyde dehydrogenase|nr:aldehyde dehydrogenase family protein [Bacteriovorax sp.]